MNKKAGAGLIIGIVIGVTLLISAIVLLAILNSKGYFSTPKEEVNSITLFLKSSDESNQVEANYLIEPSLSKGVTNLEGWTEIKVPANSLNIYCWNEVHYLSKIKKEFNSGEINLNKSTIDCKMNKVGTLTVKEIGDLIAPESQITLNLSSSDWLYHPLILASWSGGIVSVNIQTQTVQCESSSWINWTEYIPENNTYIYLPKDEYRCGDEIEFCEAVSNNYCQVKQIDIPSEYATKFDKAFYLGGYIFNSSKFVTFNVKTFDVLNSLDSIKFLVIDQDFRNINGWNLVAKDENGLDIGVPNYQLNVSYKSS